MTEENPYPDYVIPSWHGEPPQGMHLDVIKDDNLIQKIMVDEKHFYYFGRNPEQVDIVVEHASCSRVHGVLIYHKALKRFALVDLKSSHGTYCGKVKLQPFTPMFLNINDVFHFGASTRHFVVREKPKETIIKMPEEGDEDAVSAAEEQLACLTEYNTTLNRKKQNINISDEDCKKKKKIRGKVRFYEEEIILNIDEFDDKIGKFRNMAVSFVISNKKKGDSSSDTNNFNESTSIGVKRKLGTGETSGTFNRKNKLGFKSESLGSMLLNAAPDLDDQVYGPTIEDLEPLEKKKKYAKEAWPEHFFFVIWRRMVITRRIMESLSLPDAILQPNVGEIVDTFVSHGGTEDEVFDMLSGSFEGIIQMANELAFLLTNITYEKIDDSEGRSKKKSRKKKLKSEQELPSISPEVGEIVIDAVKKVLVKNFNPDVADKLIESNQGDVAVNIVNSLTNNESWRPVVYKLIQEHPNSSLLSVCLKFISQLGYHNEICNIPMATNQLDIFSRIVSSSLTKLIQSHENGIGTEEYDKAFEEFVKIAAFGEHSYIFTTSLLLNMINSSDEKKKATIGHIFEELNRYCFKNDFDYTMSTIPMINSTKNPISPDVITAYQTMIRKKSVNPTDVLTLHNAYSSPNPPPIHFLRDIVFMDLLMNVIFTKDTSLNIKSHRHTYVHLLAYAACVVEKVSGTKRIHHKQELEPLIEEINRFLKIIDNSEDFGVVFNTLEELIKQPLIAAGCLQYIKSSITTHKYAVEPHASHYVLIDEIANTHVNLRDRVFQTLNFIFSHISSLTNESAEVIIQKQKHIIHRYIHLLSTGYCIPVIRHLEKMYKTNQMDVSLMRLFAIEVIDIISGPYSQEFSQTFLPILLNTDIFHDDIFDKMNLNNLVEEMESV